MVGDKSAVHLNVFEKYCTFFTMLRASITLEAAGEYMGTSRELPQPDTEKHAFWDASLGTTFFCFFTHDVQLLSYEKITLLLFSPATAELLKYEEG